MALIPTAAAQTAGMMSFQALLRDAGGTPVDGPVTLSLTIVDPGGTVLAGPFPVSTNASAGVVSVKYGPVSPTLFTGASRFLRANVTSPPIGLLNDVEIVTPPGIAEQLNTPGTGSAALIVSDSGRVGIGTAAPTTALEVAGSTNSVTTRITKSGVGSVAVGVDPVGAYLHAHNNLPLSLYTTSREAIRISDAGDVGIATSTPARRLHVVGPGLPTMLLETAVDSVSGSSAGLQLLTRQREEWWVSADGGTNSLSVRSGPGPSGTTRFLIDGTAGNVGIGTTTPQYRLDVRGGNCFTDRSYLLENGNSRGRISGQYANGPGFPSDTVISANFDVLGNTLDASFQGTAMLRVSAGQAASGDPGHIAFSTGGVNTAPAERMRISSNGNIGIGISAAVSKMHVRSGASGAIPSASTIIAAESNSHGYLSLLTPAASERGVLFGDPASATSGAITYNSSSAPNGFQFRTNGVQARLVLTSAGNVGIGTTGASSKLSVAGDIVSQVGSEFTQLIGGGIEISGPTPFFDFHFAGAAEDYSTRLICVGGDQLQLDGGRLGIGRVPASRALEVEGNASKSTAGDWLANSDRRIKHAIAPITNALEKVNRIRVHSFRYTNGYRASHPGVEDREYLNVIAQEFAEVFPDYVQPSGETLADGSAILQVDAWPLTIYSVVAIQELDRRVAASEARVSRQQLEIDGLIAKIDRLERILTRLQESDK